MKDDTINRRDAIKAVLNKPAWHGSDGSYYHGDDIRDALKSLPSADRPQGEWKFIGSGIEMMWECPFCGDRVFGFEEHLPNYCGNCGARMKGADDEDN